MKRVLFLLCLSIIACNQKDKADIIITNAEIYACDSAFSLYNTVIINDGKICAVGGADLLELYQSDKVIDRGAVYPGFIDAHCHFSGYALNGYQCDLVGTSSYQDVLNKLFAYEKENKLGWIYGRGWDQNDWEIKEYPDKRDLDSLFPNKPVILKRVDGHAVLCNQKALDMAGISTDTYINGGMILKENGRLTGILIDNATEPVENLIEQLSPKQALEYLQQAEQECFSLGLTGVVDCGVKADTIKLLFDLYKNKKIRIGNSILLSQDEATLDAYAAQGFKKEDQIQINGIKMYADGSLGSRGACLLEPYSDMQGHYGMMLSDMRYFTSLAELAERHKLQLCTHAIGDSANRAILGLYAEFLASKNDKRWRIEHAQVIDFQDFIKFRKYSIIPSVQPTHAISDMPWAVERVGEYRLRKTYAYKKLLEQNGWIALGTDFPVEHINPLGTFYTAVARKDNEGHPQTGFMKENALSRKEALLGMTTWAARSVFWEDRKGSIEVGKDADIVILDKNILNIPEEDILKTEVVYTIVQGIVVYKRNGAE